MELKERDNTSLIAALCLYMLSKHPEHLELQEQICAELEARKVITSSEELIRLIK